MSRRTKLALSHFAWFVGTPPLILDTFWYTLSPSSVKRLIPNFFKRKFTIQIFRFFYFWGLLKGERRRSRPIFAGWLVFFHIYRVGWSACWCPILALSSAIERRARGLHFPLLDPPTDAGNYLNEQDEVRKVGKKPRFCNIGVKRISTIFMGLDGALAGLRFSRWVAQSREELTFLLLRYSNHGTDIGNYLNE